MSPGPAFWITVLVPSDGCSVAAAARTRGARARAGLRGGWATQAGSASPRREPGATCSGTPGLRGQCRRRRERIAPPCCGAEPHARATPIVGAHPSWERRAGRAFAHLVAARKLLRAAALLLLWLEDATRWRSCVENAICAREGARGRGAGVCGALPSSTAPGGANGPLSRVPGAEERARKARLRAPSPWAGQSCCCCCTARSRHPQRPPRPQRGLTFARPLGMQFTDARAPLTLFKRV